MSPNFVICKVILEMTDIKRVKNNICAIYKTNQTKLPNITSVINCIANNCENRVSFANTHNDNYQNNCLE